MHYLTEGYRELMEMMSEMLGESVRAVRIKLIESADRYDIGGCE